MSKDLLIEQLDDLRELDGDFIGWVCYHASYDPSEIGYDHAAEILCDFLDFITNMRAAEIRDQKTLTDDEAAKLKSYVIDDVANSGGEHASYWICRHPEDDNTFVALFQYEDGARKLVDLFGSFDDALAYPETAGFDCV